MSSTEQAPEPTMDEILASIRRIIADDEANSGSRPESVSKPAAAPSPEPERARPQATPSRLVDDITQALRGADEEEPAAPPPEGDILDLTSEMVEPEPAPFPPSMARPEPMTAVREEQLVPPSEARSSESRVEPRLWEEESLSSAREGAAPAREPETREELRAESKTGEPRMTVMDRITELAAVATRTSGAEAERSFVSRSEPKVADYKESRTEDKAGEKATPATFAPQAPAEPKSFAQEQPAEADKAEVSNGAAKSLEECVREMLRPMIRDWLDKNMQQILEKAVREELAVQVREKRQHH